MIKKIGPNFGSTPQKPAQSGADMLAQAQMQLIRLRCEPPHQESAKTPSVSVFSRLKNWAYNKFNKG